MCNQNKTSILFKVSTAIVDNTKIFARSLLICDVFVCHVREGFIKCWCTESLCVCVGGRGGHASVTQDYWSSHDI